MADQLVDRSVDYLVAHSGHSEQRSLGLYGGEPLLNQRGVRRALRSLLAKAPDTHVSITTNGTVPFDVVREFKSDLHIALLVSVDGPRDEHDRDRRLPNGRGSHELIMRHLRELAEAAPDYFVKLVSINCVTTPGSDLFRLREYFEGDDTLRPLRLQISGMNVHGTPPSIVPNPKRGEQLRSLELEYLECLVAGTSPSTFLKAMFDGPYIRFFKRSIFRGFSTTVGVGGMCLPGQRKIYVNVDGALHACERVPANWPLGTLDEGLDPEKALGLQWWLGGFCGRACRDCWAQRLCSACPASVSSGCGTPTQRLEAYCQGTRETWTHVLGGIIHVLERNPHGFDWVTDVTVS